MEKEFRGSIVGNDEVALCYASCAVEATKAMRRHMECCSQCAITYDARRAQAIR
jgi:hypothetical protein